MSTEIEPRPGDLAPVDEPRAARHPRQQSLRTGHLAISPAAFATLLTKVKHGDLDL